MSDTCFAVTFRNESGDIVTLKARTVEDSSLGPSFLCIRDFLFAEGRIVDPAQERLQRRYADTRRLHVNVFGVQAIEEIGVENPGLTLAQDRSRLILLPGPDGAGR